MAANPTCNLADLDATVDQTVYTKEKAVFLIDETGQAFQFLRYRARIHSAMKPGDLDPEKLRKGLVQCLHSGSWMCIDFGLLENYDAEGIFSPKDFPLAVLTPSELFLEETLAPLVRDSDKFAAKIRYEDRSANTVQGIQDRTKSHEAERVIEEDTAFDPKEGFRLIFVSQKPCPAFLVDKVECFVVQVSEKQKEENAGVWGGGEKPVEKLTKEQQTMDNDMRDAAFDGDLETVLLCSLNTVSSVYF